MNLKKSIAVIGGGFYGCHIALTLNSLGFNVKLFEKNNELLSEASGNNQFRLHMGFHYPRHFETRVQSRDGFIRFNERYPLFSRAVNNNYYAVPKYDSLIDFRTYKAIMSSSGIDFIEAQTVPHFFKDIEGCIVAQERVLFVDTARNYFTKQLESILFLNHEIKSIVDKSDQIYVDGEPFDFTIDSTWGHLKELQENVYFEPTILFYCSTQNEFPAVTLVDGDLCSVYPTQNNNIYTLSSVPHTPLGNFSVAKDAKQALLNLSSHVIDEKKLLMRNQISKYIPDFDNIFRFEEPQLSIKTKLKGLHANRSCYVSLQGRSFSVMSGKIDTVFFATDKILSLLSLQNI